MHLREVLEDLLVYTQRNGDDGYWVPAREIELVKEALEDDDQREEVADLVHAVWARWMVHMFKQCEVVQGGALIPQPLVERWERQAHTPYKDLSEKEKESDRAIADEYLELL